MKTNFRPNGLGKFFVTAILCGGAMMAQAAPTLTPAGTSIGNTATLTYTVGGATATTLTSPQATFVVDRKIDLKVTHLQVAPTPVVAGTKEAITSFKVENLGNSVQDFILTPELLGSGESTNNLDTYNPNITSTFKVSSCKVWTSTTESGTYVEKGYIDELKPQTETAGENTYYVQLRCDMPLNVTTSGAIALVNLKAQVATSGCEASLTGASPVASTSCATTGSQGTALDAAALKAVANDSATVQTAFGDSAGRATGDVEKDGQHSARGGYKIQSAALTMTKTQAIACDPINGTSGPRHIPGAIVKYTVEVKNTGDANAKLSHFADTLDSNLEMVTDNYSSATAALSACTTFGTTAANAASNTPLNIACSGTATPSRTCTAPAGSASLASNTLTVTYQSSTVTTMPAVTGAVSALAGELRPQETVTVDFYVKIK